MRNRETMMIRLTMLTLAIAGLAACAGDAVAEATAPAAVRAEAAPAAGVAVPPAAEVPTAFAAPPPVGTRARCPVMGGEFTVTEETQRSEYKGKHYAFCCPGCKPSFDKTPEKFLAPAK